MPPVGAAIGAIGTAVVAGVNSAFIAGGAAVGLGAGASLTAAGIFGQLAIGTSLSLLGQALAPKPPGVRGSGGTKLQLAIGETAPQSFIVGRALTAGDLLYHGSYGPKNERNAIYVRVIELSDIPVTRLNRIWFEGEYRVLGETPDPRLGRPVDGYRFKGKDRLWVKFYDGRQTVADPELRAAFPVGHVMPWLADMVLPGTAYAIVTADYRPEVLRAAPDLKFEIDGIKLYDPRRDSTAGGSGPQRLNNPATWTFTANPKVIDYNIRLGIREPITGDFLWGGQKTIQRDLPASSWFSAMNECDRRVDGAPQYECGLEIRVNEEPAAIIEELDKACHGQSAEVAGSWITQVAAPVAPVYTFTDDDIIITTEETFQPFPGLDKAYNGIRAQYPDPEMGWQAVDAPPIDSAAYLAADKGRRNIASVQYLAVSSGEQVQRLMQAAHDEARKFRRHVVPLPPEARKLAPLSAVAWISARNGYQSKLFDVTLIEDLPNGNHSVALRERDPADYDFGDGLVLPGRPGNQTPAILPAPNPFAVRASVVPDRNGENHAPAIDLLWTLDDSADAIRYRVHRADTGAQVPTGGQVSPRGAESVTSALKWGEDTVLFGDEPVTYTEFREVDDGVLTISQGIAPLTDYNVYAMFSPAKGREWYGPMPVTTFDVRIGERHFDDVFNEKLQQFRDDVEAARQNANDAKADAEAAAALVNNLAPEVLDRIEDLAAAVNDLDTVAIQSLTGIAFAGLRNGWSADPSFHKWTGSALDHWTAVGLSSFGTRNTTDAHFGSSVEFNIPSGNATVSLVASSASAGQLPAADPKAPYVTVTALLRILSGSIASARLRPEWRIAGTNTYVRGEGFGREAATGELDDDWGFVVDPTRTQSKEQVFRKPAGNHDAVQLVFTVKLSTSSSAVRLRVDRLDIGATTEADAKAYEANGYADAQIETALTTITGPGGALAAMRNQITTEYGQAVAGVEETALAASTLADATAGRVGLIEASFGGANLVRNPSFALGGSVAAPPFWPIFTGWTVRPRGTTGAPAAFFAEAAADGTQREAYAFRGVTVEPGDRIVVRGSFGSAGSGVNIQFQPYARWFDAAGQVLTATSQFLTLTSAAWVQHQFPDFVAPPGAATAELVIRRRSGFSAHVARFTNLDARLATKQAEARIATTEATAASAASAVASINTTVAAEFGNFSAFVEQSASAVATAEGAATALVFRNLGGKIGLYGWDNLTNAGASILLDAPNVFAPGSVTVGELQVMDQSYNMVPDPGLTSQTVWLPLSGTTRTVIPVTSANVASVGEIRVAGEGRVDGKNFYVRPGMVLTCSYQLSRLGGTTHRAGGQIRFSDRNNTLISFARVGPVLVNESSAALRTIEGQVVVPAGAQQARFVWVSEATDGSIRFFAPSVIRRERGSVLITPDGAFFNMLAAEEAWIGSANIKTLNVGTIHIANNATTDGGIATRTSVRTAVNPDTWYTLCSFTLNKLSVGRVSIFWRGEVSRFGEWEFNVQGELGTGRNIGKTEVRIVRGSTELMRPVSINTEYEAEVDTSTASGNQTYSLQFRAVRPDEFFTLTNGSTGRRVNFEYTRTTQVGYAHMIFAQAKK